MAKSKRKQQRSTAPPRRFMGEWVTVTGLGIGLVLVHWIAIWGNTPGLTLVTGGVLALYLPGALVASCFRRLWERAHVLEWFGVVLGFSVVALMAASITLDALPWGITDRSMTLAIALLLPLPGLVQLGRTAIEKRREATAGAEESQKNVGSERSTTFVMGGAAAMGLAALLFLFGMPMLGGFAAWAYESLGGPGNQGYASLALSCHASGSGFILNATIRERGEANQAFSLLIKGVHGARTYHLDRGLGREEQRVVQFGQPGNWQSSRAVLLVRSVGGTRGLTASIGRAACHGAGPLT